MEGIHYFNKHKDIFKINMGGGSTAQDFFLLVQLYLFTIYVRPASLNQHC